MASGNALPIGSCRNRALTQPSADEPVEFIGFFKLPKGTEAPCPCCTPNHTKFGKGVVGWFPETSLVRLMGEHCFKRLNPDGYEQARDRMMQRQGQRATVAYLTANLHKKDDCIRALEAALPLAAQLDDLQTILGERVRRTLGIDLWQAVREGGSLKVQTETAQGIFNTTYATVAGYRLVDPARDALVPSIQTAVRGFRAIGVAAEIIASTDAQRESASRRFSRALAIARDVVFDLDDLRKFVSVETTATIRNWSMQPNAAAQIYIRREGLTVYVGRDEETARRIALRDVIDIPVPRLPDIVTLAN